MGSIRLAKQRQGLIYDEFEALMMKYGYSDLNHKELLNAVFLMAAGFVPEKPLKSVFNSKSVN